MNGLHLSGQIHLSEHFCDANGTNIQGPLYYLLYSQKNYGCVYVWWSLCVWCHYLSLVTTEGKLFRFDTKEDPPEWKEGGVGEY